jgi:Carboxypeptidase regulatory-like domain/Tetratricopeptide repeat
VKPTHRPMLMLAAACCAVFASVQPSSAQVVARLAGTVKNLAGQPIKVATIRAVNPSAVPREFTATSDQKGDWAIMGMRSGLWEITASAPGFDSSTVAVRVASGFNNPKLQFVLVGTPQKGAMDGVDVRKLQISLSTAESMMAQEKWDEAIAEYRNILAMAPALDMVNLALGRAFLLKKDYAGASAAFGVLLKKDARNQKALLGLGRTQYEQGDRSAAVATLEQAISIDGATSEAAEARGLLEQARK